MRNDEQLPSINLAPTAYVAELDFISQFPSIMARFNISPETVNCPCCPEAPRIPELGYRICEKRRGNTSRVVERLIAKRTELKKLQKVSPPDAALRFKLQAFEPFVPGLPKTAEENLLNDSLSEEELKRFPLFAALALRRPLTV